MSTISYKGNTLTVPPGATVLEALEAAGEHVTNSCRSGICQSCMMRATEGTPPAASQAGLTAPQKEQGFFLACLCKPEQPLAISDRDASGQKITARVVDVRPLNAAVVELQLECDGDFDYRPGQFINLVHPNGTVRSYSLASVPGMDTHLSLHVARVQGGAMSTWVHDEARPGDTLEMLGPHGTCFYVPGASEQPLLLVGTGTGLAPLFGIIKEALRQGHTGPIHLFHGSVFREGLYLVDELREMALRWPQFHYHPCVLHDTSESGFNVGAIDGYVAATLPSLKGYRAYLCGHPDLVKILQKKVFLLGVSLKEIFSDPFVSAKPAPAVANAS